jgi:hypothetical protein
MKRENNNRKYPDGSGKRPDLSSIKRSEATERQAFYDTLSITQKIAALDSKLGAGLGAVKQRARLNSLLNKKSVVAHDDTTAPATIPAEALSEIDELNAASEKKKLKAKERRAMQKGGSDEETA